MLLVDEIVDTEHGAEYKRMQDRGGKKGLMPNEILDEMTSFGRRTRTLVFILLYSSTAPTASCTCITETRCCRLKAP